MVNGRDRRSIEERGGEKRWRRVRERRRNITTVVEKKKTRKREREREREGECLCVAGVDKLRHDDCAPEKSFFSSFFFFL